MVNTGWRNSFTPNAADLLQVVRWADEMTDDEFKHLLLACFRRSPRSERITARTVCWVLDAREQVKAELREGAAS